MPLNGQMRCASTGKVFDVSKSPIVLKTIRAARPSMSVNRKGEISGTSVLEVSHPVFSDTGTYLPVPSRKVIGLFLEQARFEFVPVLHRLQGRPAAQG